MLCGFWQFLALEFNNTCNTGQTKARIRIKKKKSAHALYAPLSVELGRNRNLTSLPEKCVLSALGKSYPSSCVRRPPRATGFQF